MQFSHLEVIMQQCPGLRVPDLLSVLDPLTVLVTQVSRDEQAVPPELEVVPRAVRVHEGGETQRLQEDGEPERLGVEVELEVTRELGGVHCGVEEEDGGRVEVQRLLAPVTAGALQLVQAVRAGRVKLEDDRLDLYQTYQEISCVHVDLEF